MDEALSWAEAKARQMQDTERWERKALTGRAFYDPLDPALNKTPADTIRQVMRFPELVKYVKVRPDDSSDIETLLLDKVVRTFRERPQLKPSTLIAMWYGTPEGELLQGIVSQ